MPAQTVPLETLPLVTIGLPVYNGMPYLAEALATLRAQTYGNFEIEISDNASTDGTGGYCQQLAAEDPRIRYRRNTTNVGAMNNFRAVMQRARGELFLWAAHDDRWNETFVASLVAELQRQPAAVLATPAVLHLNEDGSLRSDPVDRPASGAGLLANTRILMADHAIGWFYGVYRTPWLRVHYAELEEYPVWGNDALWLADVALRYPVVGSQHALLWKRLKRSRLAPQNARQVVAFWSYMLWHFTRISLRRGRTVRERLSLIGYSYAYVYRLCIQRPNLPRTLWRVLRMLLLAAVTWPMAAAWQAMKRLKQAELGESAGGKRPSDAAAAAPSPTIS